MSAQQYKPAKLCLIGNCLSSGGAEKVHAVLSLFFESRGIDVHNIILLDRVGYKYGGQLLNLGSIKSEKNGLANKLKRLRVLGSFFREHKFDYIIDFRYKEHQFQELFFTRFIFNAPYITIIHSYLTHMYFPKNRALAKMIFRKAFAVVAVSKAIKERIESAYGYKNVVAMYNPVEVEKIRQMAVEPIPFNFPFVIGVGRMASDNIKQFDVMIQAFSRSVLCRDGIKLVLVGTGPQKESLEKLAGELGIADKVIFTGFTDNPFTYMSKALFLLLTSKNEGFPNVISESFASGTPVVAYDCLSGPGEMIEHEKNGLLVENQNQEELIKAMDRLYRDKELYNICKANAPISAEKFSTENIGQQWLDFLKLKTD